MKIKIKDNPIVYGESIESDNYRKKIQAIAGKVIPNYIKEKWLYEIKHSFAHWGIKW